MVAIQVLHICAALCVAMAVEAIPVETLNNARDYQGVAGDLLNPEDGVAGDGGPVFGEHGTAGREGPVFGNQDLTGKDGPVFGGTTDKRDSDSSGVLGTVLNPQDGILGDGGPVFGEHGTAGREGPIFGNQDLTGKDGPIFGGTTDKRDSDTSGVLGTVLNPQDGVLGDGGPVFGEHGTVGREGPIFGNQDLTGKDGPLLGGTSN